MKLVVSGSSSFEIRSKFRDSLAGRTVEFEVFPLSFEEFLLFKGRRMASPIPSKLTSKTENELRTLFKEHLLYGGYPKIVLADSVEAKEKYLQQILDTYVRKDIRDLAAVRDVGKFNKLLEALASQSGQLLNVAELSNTCGIAQQTVERYLFILENTYVLRLLRPFSGNLRSELFKTPKVFFYDTGLMQMLWLKGLQREVLGSVFETGVFSELAKKYPRESLFYWRTTDKKEIDFILRRKDGLVPIEAKLNFARFNKTAMERFGRQYPVRERRVAGLEGGRRGPDCAYPWEL